MSQQAPLFRVATAYTMSQYREYNRTVMREIGHVNARILASFLVYVALGAVLWLITGLWYAVVVFAAIGALNSWMTVRRLRKAEDLQYQQEQLVGTVVYEFHEDRLDLSSAMGATSNPYPTVTTVLETGKAFYIMFQNNSGAILPKEDCPEALEGFIRARLPVRRVRGRALRIV